MERDDVEADEKETDDLPGIRVSTGLRAGMVGLIGRAIGLDIGKVAGNALTQADESPL